MTDKEFVLSIYPTATLHKLLPGWYGDVEWTIRENNGTIWWYVVSLIPEQVWHNASEYIKLQMLRKLES